MPSGSSSSWRSCSPSASCSSASAPARRVWATLSATSSATSSSAPPAAPTTAAISTATTSDTTDAYSKYLDTQTKAVGVYKRIVALNPKDATNQYRLAQVAQSANNKPDAIAAYTAFLKLAPNDSLAPA